MSSSPTEALVEVTMPEGNAGEIEVVAWHKRPGEEIAEGDPICVVSVDGLHAEIASPAAGTIARLVVGVGAFVSGGASLAEIAPPVAEEPEPEPEPEPVPESEPDPEPEPVDISRFRSPAVRRLAELHDLDLDGITGSGRGGRVTREDVLAAANGRAERPVNA